jgi:hypothetical protein
MFSNTLKFLIIFYSINSFASWNGARNVFEKGKRSEKLRSLIIELVDGGNHFSALPLMKEYLIKETKNLDRRVDSALSKIIHVVGIKQFETLPLRFLVRSKSDNIRYIIAKKHLRSRKYDKAISYLRNISPGRSVYPYAKNMEATIYSIKGIGTKALKTFTECVNASNKKMSTNTSRGLKMNRDYCIAGLARTQFGQKKYENSDLLYLDVPKSSMIWPEILFEEAWNSYYQKNYNRSLGKLVSYKAPVLQHIFNPEIEVLSALSYLKLCLYQDAKKISNNFYSDNWNDFKKLRTYLKRNQKNHKRFYELVTKYERFGKAPSPLVVKMLKSIDGDQAFRDLKKQLSRASSEYTNVRGQSSSRFKNFVLKNLQESIISHKKIIGAYVKSKIISYYAQTYKAFEGMSYIKLEILAQRKAKLYSFDDTKRERGDIEYIQRNEKQYFWNFNGEFWADELGDYVFALKSEC